MAKEKVALYLLYEFEEVFMELDSDEERGQLIMAIYNYERRGIEPEFKGTLKFAWRTHIKPKIDQITANYKRKCDVNKANIRKRWNEESKKVIPNDTNVYERIPNDTNVDDIDVDVDVDVDIAHKVLPKGRSSTREAAVQPKTVDNFARLVPETASTSSEKDIDLKKAIDYYENAVRPVANHTDVERIRALIHDYGIRAFISAIDITKARGGKSLRYVESVIKDPQPRAAPKGIKNDVEVGLKEATAILEGGELDGIFG